MKMGNERQDESRHGRGTADEEGNLRFDGKSRLPSRERMRWYNYEISEGLPDQDHRLFFIKRIILTMSRAPCGKERSPNSQILPSECAYFMSVCEFRDRPVAAASVCPYMLDLVACPGMNKVDSAV